MERKTGEKIEKERMSSFQPGHPARPRQGGGAQRYAGSLQCPELLRARRGPAALGRGFLRGVRPLRPRASPGEPREPGQLLSAARAGLGRYTACESQFGARAGGGISARASDPPAFPFPPGFPGFLFRPDLRDTPVPAELGGDFPPSPIDCKA